VPAAAAGRTVRADAAGLAIRAGTAGASILDSFGIQGVSVSEVGGACGTGWSRSRSTTACGEGGRGDEGRQDDPW